MAKNMEFERRELGESLGSALWEKRGEEKCAATLLDSDISEQHEKNGGGLLIPAGFPQRPEGMCRRVLGDAKLGDQLTQTL